MKKIKEMLILCQFYLIIFVDTLLFRKTKNIHIEYSPDDEITESHRRDI